MSDLLHLVGAFAKKSCQIDSLDELCAAVKMIVQPLDYSAVASGRLGNTDPTKALHFSSWKPEWLQVYWESGFVRFDPVPMWAIRSGSAVTLGELRTALPKGHPGHKVISAAAPFGYIGGYLVPQRAADNAFGLVSFVGLRDPESPEECVALRALASITFERAEILSGHPPATSIPMPPPSLSPSELRCLKHLIEGKKAADIAKLINLSEATVRFHINNLRKKTGTASLAELAAVSIALGLVPNPDRT